MKYITQSIKVREVAIEKTLPCEYRHVIFILLFSSFMPIPYKSIFNYNSNTLCKIQEKLPFLGFYRVTEADIIAGNICKASKLRS